jgi:hypothetical protein
MENSASGKQLWKLNKLSSELNKEVSLPLTKKKATLLITSFLLEIDEADYLKTSKLKIAKLKKIKEKNSRNLSQSEMAEDDAINRSMSDELYNRWGIIN